MTKNLISITIISKNTPGVLYRIAGIFLRRKINVESLNVKAKASTNQAKFMINIISDLDSANLICKQIKKIIEVEEVMFSR